MAQQKIRNYEVSKSNVDDYLDKNIAIVDCVFSEGEGDFPLTDILLTNGDVIKTTSKVLSRQLVRESRKGFPLNCQIKKCKGKYPYYCLEAPK